MPELHQFVPFLSAFVSEGWFGQGLLFALCMFDVIEPDPASDEVLIVGLSSLKYGFCC